MHVLSLVWKRPGLTATEIAWRWLAAAPFMLLVCHWAQPRLQELGACALPLETMSLVRPVESLETLGTAYAALGALLWPLLRWLGPAAMLAWVTLGTLGQWSVMRRVAQAPKKRLMAIWLARLARSAGVLLCWLLWVRMCEAAAALMISGPNVRGQSPLVMPLVGMVIVGSLLVFTGWAVVSWPLVLAQALVVELGMGFFAALRKAFRLRAVRAQVIEVNLVQCIVKLALLVLAMVFSACPLPFQSVETMGFLITWTLGVVVWYLAMSDFFHVVRVTAYLLLVEADIDAAALTPRA